MLNRSPGYHLRFRTYQRRPGRSHFASWMGLFGSVAAIPVHFAFGGTLHLLSGPGRSPAFLGYLFLAEIFLLHAFFIGLGIYALGTLPEERRVFIVLRSLAGIPLNLYVGYIAIFIAGLFCFGM